MSEDAENLARKVNDVARDMELSDPDANAPAFDRWVNRIAEVVGVAGLGLMAAVIFANAIGRYVFDAPILWAEELAIAVLPWVMMSGLFLSVRRGQIITINFFLGLFPQRIRRPASLLVDFVSAAAFVYLAFYSFQYLSMFGGDTLDYLQIPSGWFTSALFVGTVLTAFAFAVEIVRRSRNGRQS